MKYRIVNLVASADIKHTLDLYNLASGLSEVEYEPEQFPGAVMKLTEPKASLLLFLNGQLICAGVKSEKDLRKALNKTKQLVEQALKKSKKRTYKNTKKGGGKS